MNVSFPLSLKVSLWLLANMLLLALAAGVFYVSQFGIGWKSVTRGALGEHLQRIADSIATDLQAEPEGARPAIIASRVRKYGADFFLFTNEGAQLAGDPVDLPAAVLAELSRGPRRGGPPDAEPDRSPDRPRPPRDEREPRDGPPPQGLRPPGEGRFVTETANPAFVWIGLRLPIPARFGQPIRGTVVIRAASLWTVGRLLQAGPWFALATGAVVLSILFWLPLVGGITRALKSLSGATERIAEGRFATRVELRRRDELGRLGQSVNCMADRLDTLVNGQKRFLGDVAHELGSPLGRLQVATEILEMRADPALRSQIADVREEVQHMAALVNELLAFTKAGLRPRDAALTPVPLAPLVRQVLAREDAAQRISVALPPATLAALADPELLGRALGNLVRNALRYAPAGAITFAARADGEHVLITVSDEGPGVPTAALARLGEPFYRPDAARTSEAGGTGLGLAIVRAGIGACGGAVVFRNRAPRGFEAEISLPSALHGA